MALGQRDATNEHINDFIGDVQYASNGFSRRRTRKTKKKSHKRRKHHSRKAKRASRPSKKRRKGMSAAFLKNLRRKHHLGEFKKR